MRHRYFVKIQILILALILAMAAATTANADEVADFKQAQRAFGKDHPKTFARYANKIAADSVYQPLLEYWHGMLALRRARPEALETLRINSASPYIRQQSTTELAKYYAKNKNWTQFAAVADVSLCATLLQQLQRQTASAKIIRDLWRAEEDFRDPLCLAVYQQSRRDNILTEDDMWIKLRNFAGGRLLVKTRRFLRLFRLPVSYSSVRKVVLGASRYIRGKHSLKTRARQELVMIAAMSAAKKSPKTAIRRWQAFSSYFTRAQNDHVWIKIAEHAARAHRQDALSLYQRADSMIDADNSARAWRVRAALRVGDYDDVIRTIQTMSPPQSELSAWRYWHAEALAQTGHRAAANKQMYALVNDTDDYYGLLARESVGVALTLATPPTTATTATTASADFMMALAVRRTGKTTFARRIWKHAIANSSPAQILAASQQAAAQKWYLGSINAANALSAATAHAFRYPLPYRDIIDKYSARFNLERAFVYALIRRESRFMPQARSSARARGLMQILPSTAKLVARQHGYGRYRLSRLTRVDTNVIIGTTYLHDLAKRFNAHPVQVAAGYNAGPGRAAKWQKNNRRQKLAVQVENIPFLETRLYVKSLLAARAHYQLRLQQSVPPISELLKLAMRAQ